ncbi:MAG: caspase family protein [Desulfobacteraceae bacterium]
MPKKCLVVICFFLVTACSYSNLNLPKGEPLPDIIKSHKSFLIRAKSLGLVNTGIYLENEDLYTILATGTIDMSPSRPIHKYTPEDGWPIIAKIGKDGYAFQPIPRYNNSGTRESYPDGELYMGYRTGPIDSWGNPLRPEYYRDDTGAFTIDVIVWKEKDYVKIYDFFKEINARDPHNKAVADALQYAENFKGYQVAREEVVKEVDETKKMIEELKEQKEPAQTGSQAEKVIQAAASSAEAAAAVKSMNELETKLKELMAKVAELDEMKKQLEVERKKTEQLSLALEEKEEREKDLLNKLSAGDKAPPVIVVASPVDGLKTESRAIQLTGVTEDDTGIRQFNISLNNKEVFPIDGRGIQVKTRELPIIYRFNERIRLNDGLNIIAIRSVDADGLVTEKEISITRIERRRNIWALVVGINEYQNVRNLKYAVNDARAFYSILVNQNHVPEENVILLTNQQANLRNLRRAMGTQLKKRAGQDDMVIIFFAGHGATEKDVTSPDGDGLEKYLLPVDAELDDIYTSALPMREIGHIFRRIKSERIIFIADSCYSGASGGRTINVTGIRASLSDAFLDRISGGKGTVIITASGANEVSMESDEFKHGIFTYFLLEGLKGKADVDADGLITVDELYRYVSDNVARASGQEQHPVKKGSVEGRFVLGVAN